MKLIFKIAGTFLLLASTSIALNAQTKTPDESWELVKIQAVAEKKLIFVDLYFTGCAPCAQMDKEVFPDPKVSGLLATDFITLKSDILKEEIGKKLSMKYGVTGFPTFLFINSDGRVMDIAIGFQSAEQFSQLLIKAKENAQKGNFKKYSTQIQQQDYPDFYQQAYLAGKRKVSFDVVNAYLKAQPSLLAEVPFVIITGLKIGNEYDDFFLKNANKLFKDYGSSNVNMHVFNILQRKKKGFEKANDLVAFQKLLAEVKPLYTAEEWTKYSAILLEDFGATQASEKPFTLQN